MLAPNVETDDSIEYEAVLHVHKWPKSGAFWFIHDLVQGIPVHAETVVLDLPADRQVALYERRVQTWDAVGAIQTELSAMTNLHRRLKKLEVLLTDSTGFVPGSPKCLEYWDKQFYLFVTGQGESPLRNATVDVFHAWLNDMDDPAFLSASTSGSDCGQS